MGYQEPILFSDRDLKMVRLRAFGNFTIQISDARIFINQIVGTMGLFQDSDIADYLKNIIVSKLAGVISRQAQSVTELPAAYGTMSEQIKVALQSDFENIGLSLPDLYIASISVPEEVQQLIDQRSGMSAVGNMDEFMKFKMAMSIQDAANNANGAAGLGMGFMMPQMAQQAMARAVQPTTVTANQTSPVEKLKDLKNLLDLGIITQAEFNDKKTQLLSLI